MTSDVGDPGRTCPGTGQSQPSRRGVAPKPLSLGTAALPSGAAPTAPIDPTPWRSPCSRYPLRDIAGSLASAPDLESSHRVSARLSPCAAVRLAPDRGAVRRPNPSASTGCTSSIASRLHRRADRRRRRPAADETRAKIPAAQCIFQWRRPPESLLEKLFHESPGYEPDRFEGPQLQPLTAPVGWRSCACLPLNDHDELLGLIVLVSPRPNAFGPAALEALQPLRGLASLAIARRLHAGGRPTPEAARRRGVKARATRALRGARRALELRSSQRAVAESEARGATLQAAARRPSRLRAASHHAGHDGDAQRLEPAGRGARGAGRRVSAAPERRLRRGSPTPSRASAKLAEHARRGARRVRRSSPTTRIPRRSRARSWAGSASASRSGA